MQVMEMRKRLFGEERSHTSSSILNLASTYVGQARLKEAEELEVQVIEAGRRMLGEESPRTLNSISCLADLFAKQGRYTESLALYKRANTGFSTTLGKYHQATHECRQSYMVAIEAARNEQSIDVANPVTPDSSVA